MTKPCSSKLLVFLSTPSARRATGTRRQMVRGQPNFYPRPPRGGRRLPPLWGRFRLKFLSTPSARRATQDGSQGARRVPDFYPRPPRGGRLDPALISTSGGNFYPRPPRGGRQGILCGFNAKKLFLSTPSARRATYEVLKYGGVERISIHALREEGDPFSAVRFWLQKVFLSTPSARRATLAACAALHADAISIHALREEGDTVPSSETTSVEDFYPRPPRGGRLQPVFQGENCCLNFYPRPPRGGRRSLQQQRPA